MLARAVLVGLALFVGSGCDFVVGVGDELLLGNRGLVLGVDRPNAVLVNGGSLDVRDADVTGRGVILEPAGAGFPQPGEAILATSGRVQIRQGRIEGGNAIGTAASEAAGVRTPMAPALRATDTAVEIGGGTLISGGAFGTRTIFDTPTVRVDGGSLRILGGTFQRGMRPAPPLFRDLVTTRGAVVEISGGTFQDGDVTLDRSISSIRGGRFEVLRSTDTGDPTGPLPPRNPRSPENPDGGLRPILLASALDPEPCTDIRGGTFGSVLAEAGQLFIFGRDFTGVPGTTRLRGTFADGSAFDFDLAVSSSARVTLAPPEAFGCVSELAFARP